MVALRQNSDPHANHDTLIISIVAIFSVLSSTALLMRLASKRIKKTSLDWDDYLAIGSWVFTLAQSIVVGYGPKFSGLGRHAATLPPEKVTAFLKGYYALGFLQTTALATAKLSLVYLLHRIFITRGFQITMRVLAVIVGLWWITFTVADAFVCTPVRANWEPQIPHNCRSRNAIFVAGPIPWILTDFAILIAPLFVIRILQLRMRDKIGLSALVLSGGATCIIACYRFRTLFFTVRDPTWDSVDIGIWSIIETNVTVICVCFVTIKPVLGWLFSLTPILSTRMGWSRLKSSHLLWTSAGRYGRHSESNDATYNSFTNLQDGVPKPAEVHYRPEEAKHVPAKNSAIPLRTVRTGVRSDSSDEMV